MKNLIRNITETLKAAKVLIDDGFGEVMVYTSEDPIVAKELKAWAVWQLCHWVFDCLRTGILKPIPQLIIEQTKCLFWLMACRHSIRTRNSDGAWL